MPQDQSNTTNTPSSKDQTPTQPSAAVNTTAPLTPAQPGPQEPLSSGQKPDAPLSQALQHPELLEKEELTKLIDQLSVANTKMIAVLEENSSEQNKKIHKLLFFQKIVYVVPALVLIIFLAVVTFLTIFFLLFPRQAAQLFVQNEEPVLVSQEVTGRAVLGAATSTITPQPFSGLMSIIFKPAAFLSLQIVKTVSPQAYQTIAPSVDNSLHRSITDVSVSNIEIKDNGIPGVGSFSVDDKDLIKNLNADFVRGKKPGEQPGDLAVIGENDTIKGLQLTSNNIQEGSITTNLYAPSSVTTSIIANYSVTSLKIASGSITNDAIAEDAAISDTKLSQITTSGKVAGSAMQLSNGGGLENSSGLSLLRSCSSSQILIWDGSNWTCGNMSSGGGSGDITSVTAGNGLTGGASSGDATVSILLPTTGTSLNTSSNSGLEVGSSGVSLIRGCNDGQILIWNSSFSEWQCADQTGGGGGGIATIKEAGVNVVTSATSINFGGSDFDVTNAGAGQGNIALATTAVAAGSYGSSGATVPTFTVDANGRLTAAGSYVISGLTNSNLSGSAGITNANLANSSLTVTAGTGLSGGGVVSLGGSTTLNLANTAVGSGSYGSSGLTVPTFTVDQQGRLTAAGSYVIQDATTGQKGVASFNSSNFAVSSGDVTIKSGGVGATELASTAVTGGSYGSGTQVPTFTVDADGRLTAASSTTISGLSASNLSAGDFSSVITSGTYSINISGSAGSATSATTATTSTNANNVATNQASTNANYFPLFVGSSTNSNQPVGLGTGLTFNPSTNTLATTTFSGALSGNASTATILQTARNINGVSFNGSADITVTAAAGTLTGNTLNSGVTASSLTSVGSLVSGTVIGSQTFTTNNIADSGALTIKSATTNALTLDSGTTGTVNIGTGTLGKTINIGTDNTTKDTINIGSTLDDVAITGDQWSITNAGVLTVASCSGCGGGSGTLQATYNNGQTIDLSGAGQGAFLTLGQNAGTGNVLISPNAGGQAALLVNDFGVGDLFSASQSGTTRFTISNTGAISAATSNTINGISISSGTITGATIAAGSNTISGLTASNLTAGDFSSVINTGIYSINISGSAGSATSATSATTATNANNVNLANDTTNATDYLVFTNTATGNQPLKTNTGISVNPSTGVLSATTFSGALSGNASTTTALQTPRTINGVSFDGTGNITVAADAGTLTGNTLSSGVTASSLTSVGSLVNGTVIGTTTFNSHSIIDSGALAINAALGSNITLGTNAGTGTVVVGPNAGGQASLVINNQGTGDLFTASTSGSTKFVIANTGTVLVPVGQGVDTLTSGALVLGANTANALTLAQNTTISGSKTFTTGTGVVSLNGDTTIASGKLFTIAGGSGNPTTTNGTIWYDTTAGKLKIVEAGVVKVVCNTTDLGCGTGGGGGIATVKEGGSNVVTSATALNFAANDFAITDETAGQAGVAIDYVNSKIVRSDQAETITGGWTFTTAATTFTTGINANGGISTSTPNQNLTLNAQGIGNVLINPNAGGQAALVVNDLGTGDLFTASASGTPKFTVKSNGDILATGALTGATIAAGSNTISGLTASNLTAGDFSSAITSGTYSINISGSAGSATSATSATNATNSTNVATTGVSNNANYYPLFVASSSNGNQAPSLNSSFTFNPSNGTLTATTFSGGLTGNASTATALQTPRTINGVSFDGTGNITVPADAGTLTNTTLNSTVVNSSLTSVGTLTGLTVSGTAENITLGGTTGVNNIVIQPDAGGKSALVINKQGALGDIFTASASGTPKFTIKSNGDILATGSLTGATIAAGSNTISGLTASNLTAGDFSSAITSGTYSINISGSAGSAASATSATNATNSTNVATTGVSNNVVYYPVFVSSSSNSNQAINLNSTLNFNPSNGTLSTTIFSGALSGNASTATVLQTARNINGVSFNGSADITVTAAAGTLTGNTLNSGVTASSLTSVGTLTDLIVSGTAGNITLGGTTGINNILIQPDAGGQAALIINKQGANGDLFTASASGTPKFIISNTGSASQSGNFTIDSAGTISTTKAQTLTIGDTKTGNINFYSSSNILTSAGNLTLAGTVTATTFSGALSGNATTATTATNANNVNLANDTTNATDYLVFTNTATGNQPLKTNTGISVNPNTGLLTATTLAGTLSTAAQTAITSVGTLGSLTVSGAINANGGITTSTTNTNLTLAANGVGTVLVQPNAGGQSSFIINNQGVGDLFTASASGTQKFTISNSGSASQSGSLTMDTTGSIQTTKNQTLTIGGDKTGNITLSPLNGGTGSTLSINALTESNAATTVNFTGTAPTIQTTGSNVGMNLLTNGSGALSLDTGTTGTVNIGTGTGGKIINIGTNDTTSDTVNIGSIKDQVTILGAGATGITLGNNNGNGTINITPNAGGQAALIVNKQGANGDLFTASSSGTPKFTISNSGAASQSGNLTISAAGAIVTTNKQTLTIGDTNNTGNINFYSSSNLLTSAGNLTLAGTVTAPTFSGALSGNATTATTATTATNANNVNLANDTTSATDYLVFTNTATGNQPLKTNTGISVNPNTGLLTATTLAGTISTAAQTNITSLGTLSSLTVSGAINANGGITTSTTDINLSLTANGVGNILINPNAGGQAALIVNKQATTGDIFSASSSGTPKFTISNSGSASTSGNLTLDAAGTISTTKAQTLTIGDSKTGNINFYSSSNVLTSAGNLTLAGSVTAPTFSGALSGNATTATTATNANNVATTAVSNNATYFPLFVASSSNSNQAPSLDSSFQFNPNTHTLTATTFAGTLSTAAQTNITSLGTLSSLTVSGAIAANGGITFDNSTDTLGAFTLAGTVAGGAQTINNVGTLAFGTNNLSITSATLSTTANNTAITLTPNGSGNTIVSSDADSGLYIGSSANVPAPLSVTGGIGSNAALILNQTNSANIIAASASGSTKFTLSNAGLLSLVGGQTSDIDTLSAATLKLGTTTATSITIGNHSASGNSITLDKGSSGTFTLLSNGSALDCSGFTNSGKLTTNSSGNVICANDASSGGSTLQAAYDGGNTINLSTNNLVIGNIPTGVGNVLINPNAGGQAALIVNKQGIIGNPDLFTASASGVTKFSIDAGGNATAAASLNVGQPTLGFANAVGNFAGSVNNYMQIQIQNKSNGNAASSDFIATADNGTDTTNYIDFGINGSGYNQAGYNIGSAGDGYLYTSNGALSLGTASNKPIVFHTNGTTSTNEAMRIDANGKLIIGTQGGTGNAQLIVNQTNNSGSGDIFTASASGTTKFTINNSGDLVFSGTTRLTNAGLATLITGTVIGSQTFTTNTITDSGALSILTSSNGNLTLTPNGSGNTIVSSDFNSGLMIGSSANVLAPLSVSGGIGSNAAFILNNTNSGDLFTASASGTTKFTIANTGAITGTGWNVTSGGALTVASCSGCGAGSTSPLQLLSGALVPLNSTVDFLLGAQASSSAKFAVLNMNNGTPTASVSAGIAGGAYLTAAGVLGTTARQTLTIGDTNTGAVSIVSGAGLTSGIGQQISITPGNGAGATGTGGAISLTGGAGGAATGAGHGGAITITGGQANGTGGSTGGSVVIAAGLSTVSNGTGGDLSLNAGQGNSAVVDGLINIGTSHASGITIGNGTNNATVTFQGNGTITGTSLSSVNFSGAALTVASCTGCGGGSTSPLQLLSGALVPLNSTVDFLIGGQASTSAKFAVLNVNNGTPTASVSAGTAGGAYLTAAGTLATTAKQTLTIGGTTTGNVAVTGGAGVSSNGHLISLIAGNGDSGFTGGNVSITAGNGVGSSTNGGAVTITGGNGAADGFAGAVSIDAGGVGSTLGSINIGVNNPANISFGSATATYAFTGLTYTLAGTANSNFAYSTTTANAGLSYSLNNAFIINQTNSAAAYNIFTASSSGTTRFSIGTNGEIGVTAGFGSNGQCLISGGTGATVTWGGCVSGGGVSNWVLNSGTGTLSEINQTVDVLMGGTATTGANFAKFAFTHMNSGTPTASISAGTTGALVLSATGTISTTVKQNITIGDTNTGDINISTDVNARIVNIGTGGGATTLNLGNNSNGTETIKIGVGSSSNLVQFFDNTSAPVTGGWANGDFHIGSVSNAATSGHMWIRSNGVNFTFKSTNTNVSDYSEFMLQQTPGDTEPGDVMVMSQDGSGTVAKSSTVYDNNIAGAHTTNERGTSNNDLEYDAFYETGSHGDDPKWANVGMVGQVYVKVNMQNGTIKAGDPITTSSMPGVAMKATEAGRIVGYAEQGWSGAEHRDGAAPQQDLPPGVGMVLVYIHPTWYDVHDQLNISDVVINSNLSAPNSSSEILTSYDKPQNTYTLTDTLGSAIQKTTVYADAVIGNLKAGSIQANELAADNLHAITGEFQTLDAKVLSSNGITINDDNGQAKIILDKEGNGFFAGTITADKIKANSIEGLDVMVANLTAQNANIANSSGGYVSTPSGSFNMSSLSVLGAATVSADLRVKGNGLVEGVLSVIDTVMTKNIIVSSMADFFGNVVFHNDISVQGRPTFNSDTAGFAVIKTGAQSVKVTFDKVYETTPVVTANITVTGSDNATTSAVLSGVSYVITKRDTKGFTIILNTPATEDIPFSWSALSVKDAKTSVGNTLVPTPSPTGIFILPSSPTP